MRAREPGSCWSDGAGMSAWYNMAKSMGSMEQAKAIVDFGLDAAGDAAGPRGATSSVKRLRQPPSSVRKALRRSGKHYGGGEVRAVGERRTASVQILDSTGLPCD